MALYNVSQAGETLSTDPLHILRLNARGHLSGPRIGASGPLRFLSGDLENYVAAGAPDFEHPPLSGIWFDPNERNVAAQASLFKQKIGDAIKVFADAQAEPAATVSSVIVAPTPAMRTLASAPVPKLLGEIKRKNQLPPFASTIESAFVFAVRQAAANVVRQRDPMRKQAPLSALYADRESYQAITAAAVVQALAETVNYRRIWPGPSAFAQPHTVTYSLSLGSLIPGNASAFTKRIVELSF